MSFVLQTLKEVKLKCEMCVCALNQDIDKYGHADIDKYGDFWLKYISSLFKWIINIRIRQNVH